MTLGRENAVPPLDAFEPLKALHEEHAAIREAIWGALELHALGDVAVLVAEFLLPEIEERIIISLRTLIMQNEVAHGTNHGISRMWHICGTLQSKAHYHLGKLHGISRLWDDYGELRTEVNMEHDRKHGIQRDYMYSKHVHETRWERDKEHGPERWIAEDGVVYKETLWRHGQKHGLETWWGNKGEVVIQNTWEHDVCVGILESP